MSYHLSRNIWTADFIFGLIFASLAVFLFVISAIMLPSTAVTSVVIVFAILIFLLITYGRFLRSITFDFDESTLRTVSLLKSEKEYALHEVKDIRLLRSVGIGKHPRKNLTIRFHKSRIPHIYEVRTQDDLARTEEILRLFQLRAE